MLILLSACGANPVNPSGNVADAADPGSCNLNHPIVPTGVESQLWAELTGELQRVLQATAATRNPAAVPTEPASRISDFSLDLLVNGEVTLAWTYCNKGDYNQDGEVNVSDLTPIGQNWNAREGDANWPRAMAADGDGDGLITVADITPIGQCWQNAVRGYCLQTSTAPNNPSSWIDRQQIEFSDSELPAGGGCRRFSLTYPALDGSYYRVVPCNGTERGIASNHVMCFAPIPQPVTGVTASQGTLIGKIEIAWTAGLGELSYIVERAEVADGPYLELGVAADDETRYTDKPPLMETHYWYRVIAERSGNQSEPSAAAEGWALPRNWYHTWGCSNRDVANALAVDTDGSVYVTGNMYIDDSYDWHGTVIKYQVDGHLGWIRQLIGDGDDELYDILIHPDGMIFTAGITAQYSESGYLGFIGRGNRDGAFDKHILLDAAKNGSVDALALAEDGNLLIFGKMALEGYDEDLVLAKLDPDFNVIWSRTWSWFDDQQGNELLVAADGTIYAAGYYYDDSSSIHGLILRFSADGELLAQQSFTGGGSPRINGLAVDGLGNVCITGHNAGCGSATMFMAGLTPDLALNWAYELDESNWNQGTSATFNAAGNALVLGFSSVTASYLLEFTPDGTLVAKHELHGDGTGLEARDLLSTGGVLYVTGETREASVQWWVSEAAVPSMYASVTEAEGTLLDTVIQPVNRDFAWIQPLGIVDAQDVDSDYFTMCTELPLSE